MLAQRSFDDLGTPLAEVTFCVLDLETTGGSPTESAITEVGAVKVQRGEVVGTFQTLVDPGQVVPAFVRLLTGISSEMLVEAPPIQAVLPSLLEFLKGTVLVAHNARFDVSFVNQALVAAGYEKLDNQVVDTAQLARKVLAGEVPNHRLATLASHLRCAHQPTHRAFADVLATIDVLHHLIERVTGFGVVTLEDLIALTASKLDGTFNKISLTDGLPKGCGVYRFLGNSGNTLYVGKASNVRARVRSYFYGDPRRKIKDLLRETQAITVEQHGSLLEAEVAESRAIQRELPPYNRVGKRTSEWYVKAQPEGRRGRIATARGRKADGALYLGPFPSMKVARTLIDGIRDATRVHRCARPSACRGCAFSEMGTCAGTEHEQHLAEVQALIAALSGDPAPLYDALEARLARLARFERFEEAVEVRERASFLARTIERSTRDESLRSVDEIVLLVGSRLLLVTRARLVSAVDLDGDIDGSLARLRAVATPVNQDRFETLEHSAEARVIGSWIERHAADVTLISVRGTWALPVAARPQLRFTPTEPSGTKPLRDGRERRARRRNR